jgi:pimeloyl-ACP methyl ester carboxylesterase
MNRVILALVGATIAAAPSFAQETAGYAPINGIEMYYEIHGTGEPLVLLHGAYMSIPANWAGLIPGLSETHQVIAVELQGHGRTSDADRPITYEGMADDVAALLDFLAIGKADIFGYSMGASVALQMAIRHPEMVDQLIAASPAIASADFAPNFAMMIEGITPAMFAGTPMADDPGLPSLIES